MSAVSELWIAGLIAGGAMLALGRLWLWRRRAPPGSVGPAWRFPALIALNVLVAALLYLTLDPPDVGLRAGRLVVLTAGAPAGFKAQTGDVIVALPEAPSRTAELTPDLATALRRNPEVGSLHVVGTGLTERDRIAVDRDLTFERPQPPAGFVRLALPPPVAAGAPFSVSGVIGGVVSGTVELTDPSGAVVDRSPVTAGSDFRLQGSARATGLALFELRLNDAQGRLIERIDVPLETRETTPPRVIVMAGAPGPETRFLRRWAEEAGIELSVRLSLGAGLDLTAEPAPLNAQTLSATDLLVIDERSWDALGGAERSAVRTAVAGGMGLLLRPTGPLSASTRRDWAALGATLAGGENLRPVLLEGPAEPTDIAASANEESEVVPELTRRDVLIDAGQTAVLLADADGTALATWRPFGAGRVGVWVVADSYALVLTGRGDTYGALWSRLFSGLSRAEGQVRPYLDGLARAGDRASLCGIAEGDILTGPDGTRSRLVVDPRSGPSGCAAFWPRRPGWHAVADGEKERGVVYVHPADASPSLVAAELAQATQVLAMSSRQSAAARTERHASGASWPWFLGLLAAMSALWWLERRRPMAPSLIADPRLSQNSARD